MCGQVSAWDEFVNDDLFIWGRVNGYTHVVRRTTAYLYRKETGVGDRVSALSVKRNEGVKGVGGHLCDGHEPEANPHHDGLMKWKSRIGCVCAKRGGEAEHAREQRMIKA